MVLPGGPQALGALVPGAALAGGDGGDVRVDPAGVQGVRAG